MHQSSSTTGDRKSALISLADSRSLMEAMLSSATRPPGLMDGMGRFADANPTPAGHVAQSIFDSFSLGARATEALASSGLPSVLSDLLLEGFRRGTLDYILKDILETYRAVADEEALTTTLDDLLRHWRVKPEPTNATTCIECVQRDFDRLLRRAALEGSGELILEQKAENSFHQWYMAAYPVHVIEPFHSSVYRQVLQMLADAAQSGLPLQPWALQVKPAGRQRFHLTGDGVDLKIRFRSEGQSWEVDRARR